MSSIISSPSFSYSTMDMDRVATAAAAEAAAEAAAREAAEAAAANGPDGSGSSGKRMKLTGGEKTPVIGQ